MSFWIEPKSLERKLIHIISNKLWHGKLVLIELGLFVVKVKVITLLTPWPSAFIDIGAGVFVYQDANFLFSDWQSSALFSCKYGYFYVSFFQWTFLKGNSGRGSGRHRADDVSIGPTPAQPEPSMSHLCDDNIATQKNSVDFAFIFFIVRPLHSLFASESVFDQFWTTRDQYLIRLQRRLGLKHMLHSGKMSN